LPETLHSQLASLADQEGVSLNQYMTPLKKGSARTCETQGTG
jgi:predicted HicB family RNase H-like nuclease